MRWNVGGHYSSCRVHRVLLSKASAEDLRNSSCIFDVRISFFSTEHAVISMQSLSLTLSFSNFCHGARAQALFRMLPENNFNKRDIENRGDPHQMVSSAIMRWKLWLTFIIKMMVSDGLSFAPGLSFHALISYLTFSSWSRSALNANGKVAFWQIIYPTLPTLRQWAKSSPDPQGSRRRATT